MLKNRFLVGFLVSDIDTLEQCVKHMETVGGRIGEVHDAWFCATYSTICILGSEWVNMLVLSLLPLTLTYDSLSASRHQHDPDSPPF